MVIVFLVSHEIHVGFGVNHNIIYNNIDNSVRDRVRTLIMIIDYKFYGTRRDESSL